LTSPPASIFSSDFIKELGVYLSFGTIGVWLALAVCATILMIFNKDRSGRFLVFAAAIVGIGAVLEGLRQHELSAQVDREFKRTQLKPYAFASGEINIL
jgi:hypothetical protein